MSTPLRKENLETFLAGLRALETDIDIFLNEISDTDNAHDIHRNYPDKTITVRNKSRTLVAELSRFMTSFK